MANTVHYYSPRLYFPDVSTVRTNATRRKANDWPDSVPALLKSPACNAASSPSSSVEEESQRYLHTLRTAHNVGEYYAAANSGLPLACTLPKDQLARVPSSSLPSHATSGATEDGEVDVTSCSNMLKHKVLTPDSDRSAPRPSGKIHAGKQNGADPSIVHGNVHDLRTNLSLNFAASFVPIATGVPTLSRPNHRPDPAGHEPAAFATFRRYGGVQQRPAPPSAMQPLIRGALRTATACGRLPSDGKLRDVGNTISSASSLDTMLLPITEGSLSGHLVDAASAACARLTQVPLTQSRGPQLASTLSSGSTTSPSEITAPDYYGHPRSRQAFSLSVSAQGGCVFDQNVQLADSLGGVPSRFAGEFPAWQRDLGGPLVAQRVDSAVPFAYPHGSEDSVNINATVSAADMSGWFADICSTPSAQQQLHVFQLSGVNQQSRTSSLCRERGLLENLQINTTAAGRYRQLPTPPLIFDTQLATVPAAAVAVQGVHQRQCSGSSTTSHGQTVTPLTSPVTASVGASPTGKDPKKHSLYKTELCRSFEETGTCRHICSYGVKCQFAHGPGELRMIERHPKHKSVMCKTFWEKGSCSYGQRCCFIHTAIPSEHGSVFIQSRARQCAVNSVPGAGSAASVKNPTTLKDAGKKREFSLPLSGLYTQENDAVNTTINASVDSRRKLVSRSNPVSPTKVNTPESAGAVIKFGRARRATHTGTDVADASAPLSPNAAGFAGACGTYGSGDPCAACSFTLPAACRACDVAAGDAHEYGRAVQIAIQTQQQLEQTWAVRRASFPESGAKRLPVFQSIQN